MSLTATKKSLCNKLTGDYFKLTNPVKGVQNTLKGYSASLTAFLREMEFSDSLNLQGAIDEFTQNIQDALPGDTIQDMDDLLDFMRNCTYLSNFAPAANIGGTLNGIISNISSNIQNLVPQFPEFGAGNLCNAINELIDGIPSSFPSGGDTLKGLLNKADELLNCITSLCASSDPYYVAQANFIVDDLQSLYSNLNLIDSGTNKGNFDFSTIYSKAGLDTAKQNIINSVTSTIQTQKTAAIDSVTSSINKVKELTKGDFFSDVF